MPDTKAPEILVAETPADLDSVRALHRRFVDWHMVRHAAFRDKLDAYFTPAAFEAELAALPGAFAPPSGRLLLARLGGQDAGCVGLRDRGGGVAEMKRMFVVPEAQGRGRWGSTPCVSTAGRCSTRLTRSTKAWASGGSGHITICPRTWRIG